MDHDYVMTDADSHALAVDPINGPGSKSGSRLMSLPEEVLNAIAFHLSLSITSNPSPSALVSLLLTSRATNAALSFDRNPRLYAELFKAKFDIAAVSRRFAGEVVPGRTDRRSEVGEQVHARAFAAEYKKRCATLRRLREIVRREDVRALLEEDVWTMYLMLLENDGKNVAHLTGKRTDSLPRIFPGLLRLYHSQDLVLKTLQSGYPSTDATRTLMIWIYWLLTTTTSISSSSAAELEEFVFVLRPYVFAAKQYDICFGPWTLPKLPISVGAGAGSDHSGELHPLLDPWRANLSTDSRMCTIEYYGQPLAICPPILSLAANLNFFARVDQLSGVPVHDRSWSTGPGDNAGDPTHAHDPAEVSAAGGMGLTGSIDQPGTTAIVPLRPKTNRRHVAFSPAIDSSVHDRDFKRLTRCWDPKASRGMGLKDWFGSVEGCWEGNFSFFDFEAYRNMLIAGARSLYEGQYGEQTQVWRMNEVYVRPKRPHGATGLATPPASPSAYGSFPSASTSAPSSIHEPLPSAVLNAGFPAGTSAFDNLLKHASDRYTASNATAYIVDMLEGDTRDEHMESMLSGMEGKEVVSRDHVRTLLERESRGLTVEEEEMVARARGRGTSGPMRGSRGVLPATEVETSDDIEILLVGTGLSAWGEFIVRGRIRLWDGMITLVKEYSPENRGRWLYRGYIVAGGVYVGRWRDCVTPSHLVGYEGTFSMACRDDREGASAGSA